MKKRRGYALPMQKAMLKGVGHVALIENVAATVSRAAEVKSKDFFIDLLLDCFGLFIAVLN